MIVLTLFLLTFLLVFVGTMDALLGRVPIAEIKRNARRGSQGAGALYQVMRHGKTARIFLQIIGLAALSGLVVIIGRSFGPLTAFALTMAFIVGVLTLSYRYSFIMRPLVLKFAPYYAKFLIKIRPYVNKLAKILGKFSSKNQRTDIYEMDDLLALIKKQKDASNNRIEKSELELALHVLTFGDKLVRDHMVPRKVVRFVKYEDSIGPVLLSELHDSGFSRFPVLKKDSDEIAGTLYLKDIVDKRISGTVAERMVPDVVCIKEDEKLGDVLEQFLRTKHHLFVVQNEFSEVTGIITIEDALEQMTGRKIIDESDVHDDMREFAHQESSK